MYRNFKIICFIVFLISFTNFISAQVVISTPSLGFSQACASESWNTYSTTFTFSPESDLTASNKFIVELSDETGSFASPTTLYTSNSGDTVMISIRI